MIRTLLRKEFREQWRTWKMIVFLAVFLITGIISPLLAKYTPELLRSIPNLPEGLAGIIPNPTVADSVAQYLKNISQFGILLVILLTMGVVAQEKERGTAAMLLTKPVSRSARDPGEMAGWHDHSPGRVGGCRPCLSRLHAGAF